MDPARNLQRRRTTSQLEFSSIPEEIIARPLQRMSSQPGSTSTPKPAVKQTSTLTCYRDDLQLTLDTSPFEPPSQHTPITPSVSIADSAFHEDGLDLDDELPTSFLSDDQSDLSDSDSGFSGSGNRDSSSASDNWYVCLFVSHFKLFWEIFSGWFHRWFAGQIFLIWLINIVIPILTAI